MSSIYEEALVDAKKLKELAETEAKNAILEAITPSIKKMISREAAGRSMPLFEQEEEQLPLPTTTGVGGDDLSTTTATPPEAGGGGEVSTSVAATGSPDAPASLPPVVAGTDDAPIQASGEDAMNMPLPGPDGKLVVDFEDLFVPADEETSGTEEAPGDESPASAETTPATGADGELAATSPEVPASGSGEAIPSDVASTPVVPPAEEAVQITGEDNADEMSYEAFRESLDVLSKRIDRAFKKPAVPALVKEALQERLFESCEQLEELTVKDKISPRLTAITENRLEFLHMKLKETIVGTNYQRTEEGNDNMSKKDLKKFASKLLEETDKLEAGEVTSPADSFKDEEPLKVRNGSEQSGEKAGNHAQKVTEPTVTLKTEVKKEDDDDDLDEAKVYEAELKKLEEELKEVLAAEEGEQDLAGAAASIPDKKVGAVDTTKSTAGEKGVEAAKVLSVKSESSKKSDEDDDDLDEWIEHDTHGKGGAPGSEQEVGSVSETKKDDADDDDLDEVLEVKDEELEEAVRSIKKESIKRRIRQLKEALAECEMEDELSMPVAPHMEDEAMMGGVPGAPMKDEQWGHPVGRDEDMEEQTTVNFNFDLDDLGMGDMGAEGDDDIEIVDDEGPESDTEEPEMDFGGGEEELGGDEDEEEGEELEGALPPPNMSVHPGPVSEGRRGKKPVGKGQKVVVAEGKQVKVLKEQLAAANLWNAKVLYLNKFLYKNDLSRDQKAKIAEYLDKAKTLEEAKTIYGRVKKLLEDAASKRKPIGSSSRAVARGAAGKEVLAFRTDVMESVQEGENTKDTLFEGAELVAPERNRLMELAGIKKRS